MTQTAMHYTVFNKQTNITKSFKQRTKAYNYADKKDLEHGSIICIVKPHSATQPQKP